MISTSNSVPLVGGDRKAFGIWRSVFSVPGARGDVGVLGVSWRVKDVAGVGWRKQEKAVLDCIFRDSPGSPVRSRLYQCAPVQLLAFPAISALPAFPGEWR